MIQATIPCPADRWGDTRQCGHCPENIPIGSASLQNQHGVYVHPECIATITSAFGVSPAVKGATPAAASVAVPPDLGDLVADRMAARRTQLPEERDEPPAEKPVATAPVQVSQAQGAKHAQPRDLGDEVADRMAARRGQR